MAFYSVNLPVQLQQEAKQWATSQGLSLDQFILWAVAEKVASLRHQLNDPTFPWITYRRGSDNQPVPIISGTGIRVQTLAIAAHQWGWSRDRIAEEYGLTETQINDAMGFYAAHRTEIDGAIATEHTTLVARGHDVTRTPNEWMPENASDEMQLLKATAQGRCLFTFNIKDFLSLVIQYPQHRGVILAAQSSWNLSDLIQALDRLLSETQAEDWLGQIRWLNQWRRE
jgi:uncharacterized protein (DUF433 family)